MFFHMPQVFEKIRIVRFRKTLNVRQETITLEENAGSNLFGLSQKSFQLAFLDTLPEAKERKAKINY